MVFNLLSRRLRPDRVYKIFPYRRFLIQAIRVKAHADGLIVVEDTADGLFFKLGRI